MRSRVKLTGPGARTTSIALGVHRLVRLDGEAVARLHHDFAAQVDLGLVLGDLGFLGGHLEVAAGALQHGDPRAVEDHAARGIGGQPLVVDAYVLLRSAVKNRLPLRALDHGVGVVAEPCRHVGLGPTFVDRQVDADREHEHEQAEQQPDGALPAHQISDV